MTGCAPVVLQYVCPLEFGALETFFAEPEHAHLQHNFWRSAFAIVQRENIPYRSFMLPGGIVVVLHFPPIDLLQKHSACPSKSGESFYNRTINELCKGLPGAQTKAALHHTHFLVKEAFRQRNLLLMIHFLFLGRRHDGAP